MGREEKMTFILFWTFGFLTLLFALISVLSRNVVRGGISLLLSFIALAGVYFVLRAEFVAVIQVIVYGGAILVLYLFAILMLDLKEMEREKLKAGFIATGAILSLFTVLLVAVLGSRGIYAKGKLSVVGAKVIGKLMFSKFLLPFEVVSVLLLVATIGAIAIGRREN